MDHVARLVISIGGIFTIAAVLLVAVFLVYVAYPLFLPADVGQPTTVNLRWASGDSGASGASETSEASVSSDPASITRGQGLSPDAGSAAPADDSTASHPVDAANGLLRFGVDEYLTTGWALTRDGLLHVFRLADGEPIGEPRRILEAQRRPTAWAFNIAGDRMAVGFDDGQAQLIHIGFSTTFSDLTDVDPSLLDMTLDEVRIDGSRIAQLTAEKQIRFQELQVQPDDLIAFSELPVEKVDFVDTRSGPRMVVLTADGSLHLSERRERVNVMTGRVTVRTRTGRHALEPHPSGLRPVRMVLSGLADNLFVAYEDGWVQRYEVRSVQDTSLLDETDFLPEPDVRMTTFEPLLGRTTMLIGDSAGRVGAWFVVNVADMTAPPKGVEIASDGRLPVRAHLLQGSAPVTAIRSSSRLRNITVAYGNGDLKMFYVASEQALLELSVASDEPLRQVGVSPREDALLAFTSDGYTAWPLDTRHPETNLKSLFGKVWYEGFPEPRFVWQSSSGSDAFEPKYSLTPLIFGTIKATVYSMLFAAPIALLAAIYTSEFMHPRLRAKVKPTIEMMATLPSVVLGFLAGLLFAQAAEHVVTSILVSFVTVPATLLLGAYLMQMAPPALPLAPGFAVRTASVRFLLIGVMIPVGIAAAFFLGPMVEAWLFTGDIKAWLNGVNQPVEVDGEMRPLGSPTGGWLLLLMPAAAAVVALAVMQWANPVLRSVSRDWSRIGRATLDLVKGLIAIAAAVLVALAASWCLGLVADARGTFVDTYIQRNALIVGFAMGFAVIPIIFTIADDALSTVPDHLRSASLGSGATPWQTTLRIVVPTAMSGLFSAVMIGLGRSVGETMIVLMAAGNTPVLDWNIFNGFRTLSANIAVEMPEAPRGSTHYRTLFLAALVLFLMTFVLNTLAELVRLRFRKRAVQL